MSSYRKTMSEALREVDEMKLRFAEAKYELYHKDFSSAMKHAYDHAKKKHGITVDSSEIDNKVATGPAKPKEGKTNTYRLKGDKGSIQVQVYNKGGSKPFELNMYKEEVELDEAEAGIKVQAGPDHDRKVKRIQNLAKQLGAKVTNVGKSTDGKMSTIHVKGSMKVVNDLMKLRTEEVEVDEGTAQASLKSVMALDKKHAADKKQSKKDKKRDDANRKSNRAAGMEEVGIDEASARTDAMRAMRKGKSIDPADVDNVASDDDVKAASKNIMMQLRKSVNRASRGVEFGDKKKVQVDPKIAQAVISKYNSLRRPSDKEIFQAKIAKSYKDMLKALKESTIKESKFGIINKQLKGEK